MTQHPVTCSPETNLSEAAALMLQGDCGILPVVADGQLCDTRFAVSRCSASVAR